MHALSLVPDDIFFRKARYISHMLFQPKLNSALGALYGAAIGDALGATTEFSHPKSPEWPKLATGQDDIVGGGAFSVAVGQVTDDTQMAIAMIHALEGKTNPSPVAVLQEYKKWINHAFDAGGQTRSAMRYTGIVDKDDPRTYPGAALFLLNNRSMSSGGNGTLMRAYPIAVKFHADLFKVIEFSVKDALLTHGNPRCPIAGAIYNTLIAYALNGGDPAQAFDIAKEALEITLDYIKGLGLYTDQELDSASKDIVECIKKAQLPHPEMDVCKNQGYVLVAFRYALWALKRARAAEDMTTGYRDVVLDATNRGGDSDTNAAIIGGLVGSYTGYSRLPPMWLTKVRRALQNARQTVWRDVYHPKFFFNFAYDSILPSD